ncbi:MAG: RluA family pseudouridine synthase [Spirochaetaceae bacterium]|jgi:23S rRNA pseudouridine1911/1915/1917 synthase|nr:RluA family pseudouridine synthase [Spirochaetaceae bacterium]
MGRYEGIVTADAVTSTGVWRGPMRLDVYVASVLGLLTRSQIKSRSLAAVVNGKAVKRSRPVKPGDRIALSWDERPPSELPPENIPLSIIYEDETCVVLDKAQGMVVHPGAGNYRGTLVNALLWRRTTADGQQKADGVYGEHSGAERGERPFAGCSSDRPFIVHRLDKDTSGVLIAAYTEDALRFLSGQFKERAVKKTYATIVAGAPPQERGLIDTRLCRDTRNRKTFMVSGASGGGEKGKRAITRYKLVKSVVSGGGVYSLLLLRPRTGRTHQLRVHLRHIGCPILGDPLYHKKDPRFPTATLMLHALSLEITLPHGERGTFKAPLPERFALVPGLGPRPAPRAGN